MKTQNAQKEIISEKELMQKLLIRDNRTIDIYVKEGDLPQPVKILSDGDMLFDKEEILKLIGAKSFEEEFIGSEEAAKILGVKKYYIAYLANKGRIPHYRLKNVKGSQILFLRSELEAANKYDVQWSASFGNRIGKEKYLKEIFSELLNRNIDLLSSRETDVLREIFVKDKTITEIAEKLSLANGTIIYIFHHAVKNILSRLIFLNEKIENVLEKETEFNELKTKVEFYEKRDDKLSRLHPRVKELLGKRVLDFDFSVRALNVFHAADISTVRDLASMKRKDFLSFRGSGIKSVNEVEEFLREKGLRWDMNLKPELNQIG